MSIVVYIVDHIILSLASLMPKICIILSILLAFKIILLRKEISDRKTRKDVLLKNILPHAGIVLVTAVLGFAGPSAHILNEARKGQIEENRLKREALTISCEDSKFAGKRLVETYRIARLKKGCRYTLSGTAEISRSYGGLFDRSIFRTERTSVDFVADSDVCHIALEYVIPDSEWDGGARYTRRKIVDIDEMERRKSYGTRKTTNGLVSIEKKSGKEEKYDFNL